MKKSFHHFILGFSFLCGLLLTASLIETGDSIITENELSSTLIFPAFGQDSEPIEITTDKASYSEGETIIVSGKVSEILQEFPVVIQVIAPNGNIVSLSQITVNPDKTFSSPIIVGGPLWKVEGDYTIKARYAGEDMTDEIVIKVDGIHASQGPESTVAIEGTEFILHYTITGAILKEIIPDPGANSLIVKITATSDGKLIISLPRDLIDAKTPGGIDANFFVLVDGEEVVFKDNLRSTIERTLELSFPAGAEEIEFIGSELMGNGEPQVTTTKNEPPVINVKKHPLEFEVGTEIKFDASPSSDPDGFIDDFEWWFDDEGPIYGESVTRTFDVPGKVEVTIGVTDNDGQYIEKSTTITVLPKSDGGNGKGPDDAVWIAVGIAAAAAAGVAGFAISRSRKSSRPETITTTVSDSGGSEKGKECNVCGTIIPEGKNICPNCGDTYS